MVNYFYTYDVYKAKRFVLNSLLAPLKILVVTEICGLPVSILCTYAQ